MTGACSVSTTIQTRYSEDLTPPSTCQSYVSTVSADAYYAVGSMVNAVYSPTAALDIEKWHKSAQVM